MKNGISTLVLILSCVQAFADNSYRVPTTPELEAAAKFALPVVSFNQSSDQYVFSYVLPVDLAAGKSYVHQFTGPVRENQGRIYLTGEQGEAVCTRAESQLTCEVSYNQPYASRQELVNYLGAKYQDQPELAKKLLDVAMNFQNDPFGVIEMTLVEEAPY